MDSKKRRSNLQVKHAGSCRRSGKMAMLTLCGACNEPVVGVIMQKKDRYAIECKCCGYSAVAAYQPAK